ncbi:hypothetical protein KU6B_26840 [Mameliella alba]|uniref:PAS domain-containing protein n=1 Tax=Mameliella alba TaxID=561184 RepID=UPI0013E4F366|nr:PAS domain-containing protein [Mameliella alba]BBU56419.1 hypothetical protein KU6B_26840 [Mameliella alba]
MTNITDGLSLSDLCKDIVTSSCALRLRVSDGRISAVSPRMRELLPPRTRLPCPADTLFAETGPLIAALGANSDVREITLALSGEQSLSGRLLPLPDTDPAEVLLIGETAPRPAADSTDTLRARAIAEAAEHALSLVEFDADGTVLFANAAYLELTGYATEDLLGQPQRILCPDYEARSADHAVFWDRLAAGEHLSGLYKRRKRNGEAIWLRASYTPLCDETGKVVRVIKLAQDATQETALRSETGAMQDALDRSNAIVEFDMNGVVIKANENFLRATGYTAEDLVGRPHRDLCLPAYAQSSEYRDFWSTLNAGQYQSGVFHRLRKDGSDLWLRASYTPVVDAEGKPSKVLKIAYDITDTMQEQAEVTSKLAAIDRSQAVIEFALDGTVLGANRNFLDLMGYSEKEVTGKHHRIFCEPAFAKCDQYREFWSALSAGDYHQGEYKRITKEGKDVWIQATYNPILDIAGHPVKVVKFAMDVAERKLNELDTGNLLRAIDRSQPIIPFDLDGHAMTANEVVTELSGTIHRIADSSRASREPRNATSLNADKSLECLGAAIEAI